MRANAWMVKLSTFVLLILALGACRKGTGDSSRPQQRRPPMAEVIVLKPSFAENRILVTGTLRPSEEVVLQTEVPGLVTGIFFNEGENIRKGDLLLKLKDEDLQAQLKKLSLQEELAQKDEKRKKILLGSKGISQEEYDLALNQLLTLQADMDLLKAQIRKTELRAPFDGRVGLRYVSPGSYLNPSAKIASVLQTDPLKLEFSVPEQYASLIRNGLKVSVTPAGQKGSFPATVYASEPGIDPDTRTLTVRARCNNKEGNLIPGAFVRVELILDAFENALVVPSQAIVPKLNGQTVFRLNSGKAEVVDVETAMRTDTSVVVVEGLRPGDTLLVTGLLQVKNGMPVIITKVR